MALQKLYKYEKLNVNLYQSYWRIDTENGISGGKNGLDVMVIGYKDQTEAQQENPYKMAIYNFSFVPDLQSEDNFIKQAYLYLKTLPEFSAAIDV